jgi:oligopeptide/dipeptide ABC transporter ATP-binding protein
MRRTLMPDAPSPAAGAAPILEVRDLRVHIDGDEGLVRAVEGVSFAVAPGRTVGIVGESGCGKSVTARSILRIEDERSRIVSGSILLRRRDGSVDDLAQLPAGSKRMRAIRGREIALIFQEPMTSFSPVHTIGSQIIETVRLHFRLDRHAARRKAIEQLQRVGTPHPEHILDQYAWELSGGLRQRAMIAMALVCDPALLIADEPTTALDVTTQAQVLELLRSLQQQSGMALVLITHDLGVIAETCDEVIVMYLGQVVEHGPVESVFHDARHPYTRALLQSMPNLLAKPRTRLNTLRGAVPHPLNRPAGCPFHPRCPSALPGWCDREEPAGRVLAPGHAVSCHLYADAVAQPTDTWEAREPVRG